MSDSQLSGALVPSGAGATSFAQQGSLDWVALGRMQYSTSIAVLGRLAKAGIDSLTVAFGQAMCTRLPIGVHGERVLTEAMSTLTANSCAANLLWFGTGIRHILRELVQTSQGCSLVALCAALTEGHSMTVSALVLYDIAKEVGGPQELQPSFEQWEALVRTAASAFNATTFGLRVHQIAKFAPSPQVKTSFLMKSINTTPEIPHPTDLAKVLLSIGQIVQGNLQTVSVQGGCCCSWIAAWGDFVLGLRVLVRDAHGSVVFANFNAAEASAQINVSFVADTLNDNILCVQTSHSIRSGVDFVRNCFGRQRFVQDHDIVFHSGSLTWDTMCLASFGTSFTALTEYDDDDDNDDYDTRPGSSIVALLNSNRRPSDLTFLPRWHVFSRLIAIAIIVLFEKCAALSHYNNIQLYCSRVCNIISELQPCKGLIQFAIDEFLAIPGIEDFLLSRCDPTSPSAIETLITQYWKYQEILNARCGCPEHRKNHVVPIQFCLGRITETVIYMMYMLERVVFDGPLQPTIYGMHRFYAASEEPKDRLYCADDGAFVRRLTRAVDEGTSAVFSDLAVLFAGQDWGFDLVGSLAQSDGKLYCYSQLLEELTDNIQNAIQIHVGSGQMEYRSRIYRVLYDRTGQAGQEPGYSARHTEVVDSTDYLGYDTTSNPITSEVVITETPTHLYLRYQVNTSSGHFLVAPTLFLEKLWAAVAYRSSERISSYESTRWNEVLQGHNYILIKGEGLVGEPDKCHMLRPLHGNLLGRCIAISKSRGAIALAKTQKDLEVFARYWCRDCDERNEANLKLRYFVLIS